MLLPNNYLFTVLHYITTLFSVTSVVKKGRILGFFASGESALLGESPEATEGGKGSRILVKEKNIPVHPV
jgi:hypothetical protein